jgi:hypothetical protein
MFGLLTPPPSTGCHCAPSAPFQQGPGKPGSIPCLQMLIRPPCCMCTPYRAPLTIRPHSSGRHMVLSVGILSYGWIIWGACLSVFACAGLTVNSFFFFCSHCLPCLAGSLPGQPLLPEHLIVQPTQSRLLPPTPIPLGCHVCMHLSQ